MYVPLNVHSQFSILHSSASLPKLVKEAKRFGMPAIALSDDGNLYGAIDFYKTCISQNIKPIFALNIWLTFGSRHEKKKSPGVPTGSLITLLAKDEEGYKNLCKLSSIGFLEGFYYRPRIDKEALFAHRKGIIAFFREKEFLSWGKTVFGSDVYGKIERYPFDGEKEGIQESWLAQKMGEISRKIEEKNEELLAFCQKEKIECVVANEVRYLEKQDWRAHEVLLNIQSGEVCEIWERDSKGNPIQKVPNPKRESAHTRELYFHSPEEMKTLFADHPEWLENTLRIAEKCHVELDFKTKHYPIFIPPHLEGKEVSKKTRLEEAEKFLYDLCQEGIKKRYTPERLEKLQSVDPLGEVKKRFEHEFSILTSKGMVDYMLIVYDFISWAKKRGIPVGPGRGSAAGSIISYLIGITDIEPLRFHLFFERFINPERVSYPDIDVDICMERRQEVIDYVVDKYGKEKVAQIITFGTMKAKMAIRDVGRVLNVSLSKVNKIAALVPDDPNMTLEKALLIDPELSSLMESDEEVRAVLEMAKKTEGSIRNTSTHAAGLIISADPITEHIPVCTAKDSDMVVTQFAMKPVESVGMLKIDFLGLKTLTSIQKCVFSIEENTGEKIDWSNLALDDGKTFDLLNQGKTLGVFQLESGGMQDLAKHLHIDTFEEIIAVGALYRPGPMDMIPSFIARKHGREKIEIDHPLMKEILSETYGVMVYQEQVMQIASNLAGYSLGEGDVLRRAMGKKDREEMARQKTKFVSGCEKNGIDAKPAQTIFEKIEKFASYGFNKSHAAAYAYLSYVTAFFKANYPREWMAALMTCDQHDVTKLAKFIAEAQSMHIALLPPDVNQASLSFVASPEGIRFAMAGIKGVGGAVVEAIIEEKKKGKEFSDLYDFIERIDKSRVGKKQIELLIEAGSFDFTGWSRDAMKISVEPMYEHALQKQREESMGVMSLFSLVEEEKKPFTDPPELKKTSSDLEIYQREKELLGFYLTGHPMEGFQKVLRGLSCMPLREVHSLTDGALFRSAFVVETVQVKISNRNQKKFAILTISDGMERFELPIWSEMFETAQELLKENQLLFSHLQVQKSDGMIQLSCRYLDNLTEIDASRIQKSDEAFDRLKAMVRKREGKKKREGEKKTMEEKPKQWEISLDADRVRLSHILKLRDLFRSHPGKSTVHLHFYSGEKKMGTLLVDAQWGVKSGPELEKKLREEFSLVLLF